MMELSRTLKANKSVEPPKILSSTEMVCMVVFVGGIFLLIHTFFLADHTMQWNFSRVVTYAVLILLVTWGGLSFTRLQSGESFSAAFGFASLFVWAFLALNYYLADWDQQPVTINAD